VKKRTRKIGKVVSLASSEERRFGAETGKSQRRLNEQLSKLGELHAYRRSYQGKSPRTSGVNAIHWQDYHDFLRRLDSAVQSQQQVVRECERNAAAHRQRWMAKRQRLESLQYVLDKCRAEDAAKASRLEQKQLDDLSRSPQNIFDVID